MRKTIFAIIACCLAVTSAFSQITFDFKLSEDKLQDEGALIDYYDNEHGRLFIKILGEPDNEGRTSVQIELENNSDIYEFLLFDHVWNKKELKKQRIRFEKGFGGESTHTVENINLNVHQDKLIPRNSGKRYTFPDILVEEEKTYECKIPIHLAKPKQCWLTKKKTLYLHSIIDCTVRVSVDNKDEVYEKLKRQCDSLMLVFDGALAREDFCTHSLHRVPFDIQTYHYTEANRVLREKIRPYILNKGWSPESKKYKRYAALLASLDKMDNALEQYKSEKHYCGKDVVKQHSCAYCKLSLQDIYNRLNRHYMDLHNGTVKKSGIMNEVNALYRCAQQRKNSDLYKAAISEFYEKIKNY